MTIIFRQLLDPSTRAYTYVLGDETSRDAVAIDAGPPGNTLPLLGLVEDLVDAEPVGHLTLKGFARPVPTFSVRALREG